MYGFFKIDFFFCKIKILIRRAACCMLKTIDLIWVSLDQYFLFFIQRRPGQILMWTRSLFMQVGELSSYLLYSVTLSLISVKLMFLKWSVPSNWRLHTRN